MKIYQTLTVAAALVLGAAAVWMGGLNQDEGWYLYAANMVADGKLPYRDFFFTQGPLMPIVYSALSPVWKLYGLMGARIITLLLGFLSVMFFVAIARRQVSESQRSTVTTIVMLLLATNLYHLYYIAIPKTYALAALFVAIAFWVLPRYAWLAGLALAFAAGTRISLGAILPVVGLWLVWRREWKRVIGFAVGGFVGLGLVYGPFLCNAQALLGLVAAQKYHAARGGFDIVWTVGSFSRLVRWYLPMFVLISVVILRNWRQLLPSRQDETSVILYSFLAVFFVQMLAPFPYEDYQVPVIGLMAVFVAVHLDTVIGKLWIGIVMAMCFANSFGSPLLEKWSTNGQDRFWSLKKSIYELPQLQTVAKIIEHEDPNGKELLTQDLYLAIETNRKVPKGLEMGPFAILSDEEWRKLLGECQIPIAALSGYTFAINPPACNERPIDQQIEYWNLLKQNYKLVTREENFGQQSTSLLILKHK